MPGKPDIGRGARKRHYTVEMRIYKNHKNPLRGK